MPAQNPTLPVNAAKFIRLTTEKERKEFYAALNGPKGWTNGKKKDSDQGWVEVPKAAIPAMPSAPSRPEN